MPSERENGGRTLPCTAEVTGYIAAMLGELTRMASRSDLAVLAYFLGMAQIEAESLARRGGGQARPGLS